jgi:hypothetical protein
VHGLGALLFEMLTGRAPFAGPPTRAVDLRPDLPPSIEPVFGRALAQQPWDRFATTGELAAAARSALFGPAPAAAPPGKSSGGRLVWVLAGLSAVLVLGVVVAAAAIILVAAGDDDESGGSASVPSVTSPPPVENPMPTDPVAGAAIPPVAERDLETAATAAGCTVGTRPEEGKEHSPNAADWVYRSNPPTSGTHAPTWAQDGVYAYGTAPAVGFTTHALEHGRINIQYGDAVTEEQFDQLQTLMAEDEGYHQLLYRNQTDMPVALAAAAWTKLLLCPSFNPKVFDALRAFKREYTDKAPEQVP